MSIRESYPVSVANPFEFTFISVGEKGTIIKVILYEYIRDNKYNLAFGDLIDGELNDEIVSNNNDVLIVLSTVAATIYLFTDQNPDAIIQIKGVDEKRLRLYNSLFKRRFKEIEENFIITGITKKRKKEKYKPEHDYQGFEIQRK